MTVTLTGTNGSTLEGVLRKNTKFECMMRIMMQMTHSLVSIPGQCLGVRTPMRDLTVTMVAMLFMTIILTKSCLYIV